MNVRREIIEPGVRSLFHLEKDGRLMLILDLTLHNQTAEWLYVQMEPTPDIPAMTIGDWKKAQQLLTEGTEGFKLFAQTPKNDRIAARFLRFFKFNLVTTIGNREHFERVS